MNTPNSIRMFCMHSFYNSFSIGRVLGRNVCMCISNLGNLKSVRICNHCICNLRFCTLFLFLLMVLTRGFYINGRRNILMKNLRFCITRCLSLSKSSAVCQPLILDAFSCIIRSLSQTSLSRHYPRRCCNTLCRS